MTRKFRGWIAAHGAGAVKPKFVIGHLGSGRFGNGQPGGAIAVENDIADAAAIAANQMMVGIHIGIVARHLILRGNPAHKPRE